MDVILVILLVLLLFGGGLGYSRWGYQGGFGIGGLLLIILVVWLLLGHRSFGAESSPVPLVIVQPPTDYPAIVIDRDNGETLIAVPGAPCAVMLAGRCMIRANRIEMR